MNKHEGSTFESFFEERGEFEEKGSGREEDSRDSGGTPITLKMLFRLAQVPRMPLTITFGGPLTSGSKASTACPAKARGDGEHRRQVSVLRVLHARGV